jgi:hypothetical protein
MHVFCGAPEVDQGAIGENTILAAWLTLAARTFDVHDAVKIDENSFARRPDSLRKSLSCEAPERRH